MPSGRSTTRHQDLGNSLIAGRSRDHISNGSIGTKLATMLAARKQRGHNRLVEVAEQVALRRLLAA